MSSHFNTINDKPMKTLLLDHLLEGKSISNVEAQALWRCRALPKRISELKSDGWPIVSERRKDSTGQSYVRYVLEGGKL
ncbi:helix-turn-helix domain-containing protein [Parasphingorhabdus sp.]|uniref:helix-turn-helix domain-containing protein n=1 Tax=Parasphingorhabdus sp. TaxID=2709688 RepID=UPI003A8E5826